MSIVMSNFIDVVNFNEDIVFNGLVLFDVVNRSWRYKVTIVDLVLFKSPRRLMLFALSGRLVAKSIRV